MKRLCLFAACAMLAACASVGGLTPAQGLFAAYGTYDAALAGARSYADQPNASPAIVHALNTANRAVAPARELAIAYRACVVDKAPSVFSGGNVVPCVTFNFSATSLNAAAVQLRNAALALQTKGAK